METSFSFVFVSFQFPHASHGQAQAFRGHNVTHLTEYVWNKLWFYIYIYIYIYIYVYIGVCVCVCVLPYVLNICKYIQWGEFFLKSWKSGALFTIAPFSSKSIVMGPFMSKNSVSITFFTDRWIFFPQRNSKQFRTLIMLLRSFSH